MKFDLPAAAKQKGVKRSRSLGVNRTVKWQRDRLERIYVRVINRQDELIRARVLPVYERTLSELQRDSVDEYDSAMAGVQTALNAVVLDVTADLRNWAVTIEEWQRVRTIQGVLTATGIDLATVLSPYDVTQTVDAAVTWNTSLIRAVTEEQRSRIASTFLSGFQQRTPSREIGKAISEATGLARKRANRIAADQTVKLAAALDEARQLQLGLDEWVWRHSHKRNPRPEHQARDGKHYVVGKNEPSDKPGQLPFCGCLREAWLDLDD